MYGCQVWGTRFLDWEKPYESPLERRRLAFLRRQLGLRGGVDRSVLLREAGCKPLLLYWARSVFRFASKLGEGPGEGHWGASPLMPDVLTSDVVLAGWGAQGAGSWSAEVAAALRALQPAWADAFLEGGPLDRTQVLQAVSRKLLDSQWSPADATCKRAQYQALCGQVKPGEPPRLPRYVSMEGISRHEVRQLARLRTSCHNLAVERGRWENVPRSQRVCTRCSSQWCQWRQALGPQGWRGDLGAGGRPIDDEFHLLFECEATSAARARASARTLWEGNWAAGHAVRRLMGEMEGKAELARYAAECMDIVDAAVGGA